MGGGVDRSCRWHEYVEVLRYTTFHQLFRRDDGNKQLLLNHPSGISHFIEV